MVSQNILLTTSKMMLLELDSAKIASYLPPCSLQWQDKKLLVKAIEANSVNILPPLKRREWLKICLQNSIVEQVCLDSKLPETAIKLWADVCQESQKQVALELPVAKQILREKQPLCWQIKRLLDWFAAATLLVLLSPIFLVTALLIKILTPGPIFFRQWRVGEGGKLFQVYKFRTMVVDAEQQHHRIMGKSKKLHKLENDPRITFLGKWLRKFSIDELPQLFNVLRGEMSLVGPRPWALYDALRLEAAVYHRLHALPGITGAWQITARSKILDLDAVTQYDLDYLNTWSLTQDLKILLLTVPKVLSGFGAY